MSDAGKFSISPGGKPPGESGIKINLTEPGQAKESDVLKFNVTLEGQPQQQAAAAVKPGKVEPSGPAAEFPDTRITSMADIAPKQDLGKALIDYTKNIATVSQNQNKQMDKLLVKVEQGGISQADAIHLQVMTFNMTSLVEVVSKGIGKFVTALQTMIKQQ